MPPEGTAFFKFPAPNKQRRRNGRVQAPRRYRAAQSSSKRRDETAAKSFGARPYKTRFRRGSPRARHTPFFIGGGAMYVSFESRLLFLPFPLFSSLFDFSAWENAPRKSKSGLAKPAFPRFAPRRARPVFYRRGRNVCILRTAPIVSPSRFLAVFSIFQRGKSLPYKNKSGLTKRDFAAVRPCQAHPVFYRRSHNVCILRISSLISPFSAFQQSFRFFCVENRSPTKTKAAARGGSFLCYFKVIMTRRYGSSPSEWVVTVGSPWRAECKILRS